MTGFVDIGYEAMICLLTKCLAPKVHIEHMKTNECFNSFDKFWLMENKLYIYISYDDFEQGLNS